MATMATTARSSGTVRLRPLRHSPASLWARSRTARGRGLARALVREAVGRFARMGVTQVRLETARANDAARALFASCGFRVSSVEMLAELPTPGAE